MSIERIRSQKRRNTPEKQELPHQKPSSTALRQVQKTTPSASPNRSITVKMQSSNQTQAHAKVAREFARVSQAKQDRGESHLSRTRQGTRLEEEKRAVEQKKREEHARKPKPTVQ